MITGYKPNGEPIFDNVQERIKYLEQKNIERYNNRNEHEIIRDVRYLNELLEDQFLYSFIGETNEFKNEIKELIEKIQKEHRLLLDKL